MDTCGTESPDDNGDGATPEQLGKAVKQLWDKLNVRMIPIGFGSDIDPEELNSIAKNGQTEYVSYFDAADGDALNMAMERIAEEIAVSCTYDIGEQDENAVDLDFVNVCFDGEAVPRDDGCIAGIGWSWKDEYRTVMEFCDEACSFLKSGMVSKVSGEIACRPEDVVVIII